jgi:outer membrane autotransporter protein
LCRVQIDSFTETGSLVPLSFGGQGEDALNSDLGAALSRAWDLGDGVILSPSVSAAWEHLYEGNLDNLVSSFGSGNPFTVNGPALGSDAAVLAALINAQLGKGLNLYAQYQGKLGMTNYTDQNLSGGVVYGF